MGKKRASVERPVGKTRGGDERDAEPVRVRLLGALAVERGGEAVALPKSRKVRALIAYLALAPQAVTRQHLCELLWDVPNDPRGELRWCLSKMRGVLDEPERLRVVTDGDTVRLDLAGVEVDALAVAQAAQAGLAGLPQARLQALADLFGGELADGLEIDRNPTFNGWMVSQRRRFRACHVALLEHLARSAEGEEVFAHLETWLARSPFDPRAHELLLDALARRGRLREGEEHLTATARLFDAEGLEMGPVRELWRAARARAEAAPVAVVQQAVVAAPAVDAAHREAEPVRASVGGAAVSQGAESSPVAPRRASIAVMPFLDRSAPDGAADPVGSAGALAHDIISRLAKLRSLFVIAQGSVFTLAARRIAPEDAGRMLNVDYVVSGALQQRRGRVTVHVELSETRSARVIWAEVFDQPADDTLLVLDAIGNRIVASVAAEIETVERNRAILKPPSSLDAWEAHHRGLWHMYRFNKADNARAQQFFATAVRLDPTFARAFAGLSFTHWQSAFQGWARREDETKRALEAAGQGLMADDRDPAAHWAMGRALWLEGQQEQSVSELEQAVDLSPNFAQGHYALAFVHAQSGDPAAAVVFSDHSRHLSPFDPMLFAIYGARAMALVRLGRFEEAADWGAKAAARPNAHPHVMAIAAYCQALAGRVGEARALLAAINKVHPGYRPHDFLAAFRFDAADAALFHRAADLIAAG